MQVIKFDENQRPFIDLGNGFKIQLEDEEVTDEKTLEKAKNELREEPKLRNQAIVELKELIKGDPKLSFPHNDDFYYITFLRPCHYYAKSAFDRIQKYFKFQHRYKKVCDNLTPDSVRHVFEDSLIRYFPVRDKNGCRVLFVHGGKNWKPSKAPTNDLFRALQLSLQATMLEPMSQINGASVILDMDGLSLSQVVHFTPMFAAMMLEWIQECVPVRVKGIYVVNNSYIFNIAFKIFKPFMSAKLRKRIHFLGKDFEALGGMLGKKCLMKELGGELEAEEVDGKVLTDLLVMLSNRIEVFNTGGYKEN